MVTPFFELMESELQKGYAPKSCHIPSDLFEAVERELLMGGKYQPSPLSPQGVMEGRGFRTLREAYDADFSSMALRVGKTTLHLREENALHNLDSMVLIYRGDVFTVDGQGEERSHFVADPTVVMGHDNGVISSFCVLQRDAVLAISWGPAQKGAAQPYPTTEEQISRLVRATTCLSGRAIDLNTKEMRALPKLVMLGVRNYYALEGIGRQ